MKKIMIVFILLLTVGCENGVPEETKEEIQSISSSEVNRMITSNDDFTLVDVRTKVEYESEHIKGAINIPLDEIGSTTLDKETKIVVYCQSGNRSAQAAQKLVNNGYMYVYDLGGIIDWTYETERE